MSAAHLWSWDGHLGYWIAVNSGPLVDMQERGRVMYITARRVGLKDAAFYASPLPPTSSPRSLGIEVVGEQVKTVLTVDLVTVPKKELERLRGIEKRAREMTERVGDELTITRIMADYILTGEGD